ncbi:uncharacterized protein LOC144709701 [Wolffia australiana]
MLGKQRSNGDRSGHGFRGHGRRRSGRGKAAFHAARPQLPPPRRKSDLMLEAGRLAAEYLVAKGVLPASSLPPPAARSWPINEITDPCRPSVLSRLGKRQPGNESVNRLESESIRNSPKKIAVESSSEVESELERRDSTNQKSEEVAETVNLVEGVAEKAENSVGEDVVEDQTENQTEKEGKETVAEESVDLERRDLSIELVDSGEVAGSAEKSEMERVEESSSFRTIDLNLLGSSDDLSPAPPLSENKDTELISSCDASKPGIEPEYPNLDNFLQHPSNNVDLSEIQDGYGLAISALLGSDMGVCSSVQGGISNLPGEISFDGAEEMDGVEDSLYVGYGELPMGFMGVWDQGPSEYGKFF